MLLRSITIRGFKSFADKTVLGFTPGVSVIVGPNGSGKSNLVDAISWALGEQGARSLRGGHMADVIFAGSPSRPALGMAEVKLVIDNAAGKILVPMSEIEVARTIFRSGESEYRINGQVVRLLDVQELLSETGIGRALHTVVGQGQLEEVLLAKPEDRRKYIEEAAGIAKHRRRKERAERKLANLDQDLLRLADVLAELRRQLKPLQQQAEMAGKHESSRRKPRSCPASSPPPGSARCCVRGSAAPRDGSGGSTNGRPLGTGSMPSTATCSRLPTPAPRPRRCSPRPSWRSAAPPRSDAVRGRVPRGGGARGGGAGAVGIRDDAGRTHRRRRRRDRRVEGELAQVIDELGRSERELEVAEQAFREAEQERHRVEELRRRAAESAAGRRAEIEALERSLASSERERERLAASLGSVRDRIAEADAERAARTGDRDVRRSIGSDEREAVALESSDAA